MYTIRTSGVSAPLHSFSYLEYLPKDYGSGKKFPLMIFLHGAGERGEDTNLVAVNGPLQRVADGAEYPFVILAPQCPKNKYWCSYVESLNAFLDEALVRYDVDPASVILTGLSMGGTGTWIWSMSDPDRFAAVVPVCGTGCYWNAGTLVGKPLWAFHGEADPAVPVTESITMIQSIRQRGGHPRLTIYPGVGHHSWVQAYAEPELIPWLLAPCGAKE